MFSPVTAGIIIGTGCALDATWMQQAALWRRTG
jgi:hypothetical protein